ncbi:MAG TPA: (2Fe-2S) ferredoxin domain-containing protein [Acidobacteriota bacterium]|nr:(2Fe-2S) ferredoxin domain-containing protein [Acidobacteriota bacterium]
MGPFEKHVFVCTSGAVCPVEGDSAGILGRLRDLVKSSGIRVAIRINNAGCMKQCGHGPMVVVYPENIWYCHVKIEDADAIFHQHLMGGSPVERLIYRPAGPGANQLRKDPIQPSKTPNVKAPSS